jgi:hypothetical protein
MNKTIALAFIGTALAAISSAQIPLADQKTATFDFKHTSPLFTETFTDGGPYMILAGLHSLTPLDQTLAQVTLSATPTYLCRSDGNGIGTGPYADGELRNGGGTPFLSGATLVEIVNVQTPPHTQLTHLGLLLNSVNYSTQEGYLIYGSKQDARFGPAQLDLLVHGMGTPLNNGWVDITGPLLSNYRYFYVTADNGDYSSINLGDGTKLWYEPTK